MACESTVKSEIEEGIAAAMKDVVEGLTKPLSPEEKSPKQQTGKTLRIAFKGSLQEVNRFYYSKGWTDGLPIITDRGSRRGNDDWDRSTARPCRGDAHPEKGKGHG